MGRQEKSSRERVAREASTWVVQLVGQDKSADLLEAFETWRGQSPHHEVAYERAALAWRRSDRLQALAQGSARVDADLLAPKQGPGARWAFSQPVRWATATLVVCAAVVGSATVGGWASPAYATAVGERRLVLLPDGTQAELNTDTKIVVHFGRGRREVVLLRGEALFKVADDSRPFIVRAKHAQIRAKHTEMDIRIRDEEADIVMRQGEATISPASIIPIRLRTSSRLLPQGTDAEANPDSLIVHPIASTEIERVLAWRQGAIELSGQTLGQAVEEFNRYNRRRIVIADPSISALRLAGYFQSDDVSAFVNAVTGAFPVRARDGGPGVVVLSAKPRAG